MRTATTNAPSTFSDSSAPRPSRDRCATVFEGDSASSGGGDIE
ncbi:Uncharacterised protein [Mycobacteroides abscessus subsp. abscessus]|nr:Uncharacterised protein [Mycobacteroides abscessus subsp. abscessus]